VSTSRTDLSITTSTLAKPTPAQRPPGCSFFLPLRNRVQPKGVNVDRSLPSISYSYKLVEYPVVQLMLLSHSKYLCRKPPTTLRLAHLLPTSTPHSPLFLSRDLPKMDTLRAKMSSLAPHGKRHKVTIVGSGNWCVCYIAPQ
jgi:hypothetical protein